MTAPDFTCSDCGKRYVAQSADGGPFVWAGVDRAAPDCEKCRNAPPPARRRRSGLTPVANMRERENAQRAARGEPPMVDVPIGEAVRRVGSLVGKVLGIGPKPPKVPAEIEAHGEPVEK